MKKLMSLGCLMALIFAGASAFATDWFDAVLPSDKALGNGWTAIPDSWDLSEGVGSFKEWDEAKALTYQADEVAVSTNDATVITSLKFTAIDGSELEGGVPVDLIGVGTDAKAGLTVVDSVTSTNYWGLYNGEWVQLTGATPDLTQNVTVKIALCKYGDGSIVKYSVNDVRLGPADPTVSEAAPTGASFQRISYLGNCPAIASLNGKRFDNDDDAKESIETGAEPGGEIPTAIKVSRTDLLERGIDPDDATAVNNYLTQKQTGAGKNGQYGWVNVALGIDDTNVVAVAGTENGTGSVTVNFGFNPDGSSDIAYVIDNKTNEVAEISTSQSGIHTVKVMVSQGGAEVEVVTEQVGVMNTGKEVTEEQKTENKKVYDIVAVPFNAFQGKVTVANVLNTAELTEGDTLYILNNNKYDTFALTDGKWVAVGETSYSRTSKTDVETKSPEAYDLKAGQAIWIERNANSKIVFTGKGETTESHTWTWTSGEYSLVANPTVNDFVLPTGTENSFGEEGDMIIVEDVANPQQFEKVKNDLGKFVWGEWVTTTNTIRNRIVSTLTFVPASEENPCTIPAGIGFWYYNKDGAGAVTIDFGKNK